MIRIRREPARTTHDIRVALLAFAPILLAACIGCGYDCHSDRIEQTIPVTSLPAGADAGSGWTTDDLVSQCQRPAFQACWPLCDRALGHSDYYSTCELVNGDGGLAVHFVYNTACPL